MSEKKRREGERGRGVEGSLAGRNIGGPGDNRIGKIAVQWREWEGRGERSNVCWRWQCKFSYSVNVLINVALQFDLPWLLL